MNNKEIMDRLQAYYLTQDPKIVARALAAQVVDLNRIWHILELPDDERECLIERIQMNLDQLYEFLEKGPTKDMKLILRNSS